MKLQYIDTSYYGNTRLPTLNPNVIICNILSPLYCNNIVNEMKMRVAESSGVHGNNCHIVDEYHRSSEFVVMNEQYSADIERILTLHITEMCAKQINAKQIKLSEPLQFLCYKANKRGHFRMHTDNAYIDANGKFIYTSPNRVLTAVVYLNEEFDGGEIEFGSIVDDNGNNLVFKPTTGSIAVFPSDLRFPHEAKVVTKGDRYCIVAWFDVEWNEIS